MIQDCKVLQELQDHKDQLDSLDNKVLRDPKARQGHRGSQDLRVR